MKYLYRRYFSLFFIFQILLGLIIVPSNADKWVNLKSTSSTTVKIELDRNAVTVGQEFEFRIKYKLPYEERGTIV